MLTAIRFLKIFNGFVSDWCYEYAYKIWSSFVALPVPEIIGVLQKFRQSLDAPTIPFLQNYYWAFVRMDPMNVPAKFEVRSFTRSWDNSDWSFGWGLRTHNLGEEEAIGSRWWYRSKQRWWVPIDISAFVLQHATFLHDTSRLPKISPCFPGSMWMAFGLRRAKVFS